MKTRVICYLSEFHFGVNRNSIAHCVCFTCIERLIVNQSLARFANKHKYTKNNSYSTKANRYAQFVRNFRFFFRWNLLVIEATANKSKQTHTKTNYNVELPYKSTYILWRNCSSVQINRRHTSNYVDKMIYKTNVFQCHVAIWKKKKIEKKMLW